MRKSKKTSNMKTKLSMPKRTKPRVSKVLSGPNDSPSLQDFVKTLGKKSPITSLKEVDLSMSSKAKRNVMEKKSGNVGRNVDSAGPPSLSGRDKQAQKATRKLPPLVVRGENFLDLREKLGQKSHLKFLLHWVNDVTMRIVPKNYESQREIIDILKNRGTDFFTFTEKSMRPRAFLVRGFPKEMSESAISDLLAAKSLQEVEVLSVERMHTVEANKRNIKSNLFKINTKIRGSPKSLLEVKSLENIRVAILPFRNANSIIQCFRCQGIGHVAPNCNMNRKCLRCSGNHGKEECRAKEDKSLLCCALCGGKHAANFQYCTVRNAAIQRIKSQQASFNKRQNTETNHDGKDVGSSVHSCSNGMNQRKNDPTDYDLAPFQKMSAPAREKERVKNVLHAEKAPRPSVMPHGFAQKPGPSYRNPFVSGEGKSKYSWHSQTPSHPSKDVQVSNLKTNAEKKKPEQAPTSDDAETNKNGARKDVSKWKAIDELLKANAQKKKLHKVTASDVGLSHPQKKHTVEAGPKTDVVDEDVVDEDVIKWSAIMELLKAFTEEFFEIPGKQKKEALMKFTSLLTSAFK